LRAAQWTQQRREELLAARAGIAFETVLSAPDKLQFRAFFVGTSDPGINAARVARRYMGGGHHVPIEKIVDRYRRSLANLPVLVRLAQRVYVFDNSIEDQDARLCVRLSDGAVRKVYGALPDWIVVATSGLSRHEKFEDMRSGG